MAYKYSTTTRDGHAEAMTEAQTQNQRQTTATIQADLDELIELSVDKHAVSRWIERVNPDHTAAQARAALLRVYSESFDVPLENSKTATMHPEMGLVLIIGSNYYGGDHIVTCYWLSEETADHGVRVDQVRYCTVCGRYYRLQGRGEDACCQHDDCGSARSLTLPASKQLPETPPER